MKKKEVSRKKNKRLGDVIYDVITKIILFIMPAINLIINIVQFPIIKDEVLIQIELIWNVIILFFLFIILVRRIDYKEKNKQERIEFWIKHTLKEHISKIFAILITLSTFILKSKNNVKCLPSYLIKTKDENLFMSVLTYLKTRDGYFIISIVILTIFTVRFLLFWDKMVNKGRMYDYSSFVKNFLETIFVFFIYISFWTSIAIGSSYFWIEVIKKIMILFVLFSIVDKLFSIICYKCSVSHVWKLIVCMIQKGKTTSEVKVEPKVQDKPKNKRTEATEEPKAKEYKVQPAAKSPIGIKRFKRIQGSIRIRGHRRAQGPIRISRHSPIKIEKSSKL